MVTNVLAGGKGKVAGCSTPAPMDGSSGIAVTMVLAGVSLLVPTHY